ncbi:MAG: ABC transporter permease, partial [Bacteroidales bacterium]|nr:ABC transporter permease [Bacteroidales bacterium]
MKKAWRVCLYEYLRHVRRKRFLFALFSIPLIGAAAIGIGVVVAFLQYDSRPIGYMDLSGQFNKPLYPDSEDDFGYFKDPDLVHFPDEKAARAALDNKIIQAYYVIQPDYLENGRVKQVAVEAPSETADSVLRRFLVLTLLKEQPGPVRQRIL